MASTSRHERAIKAQLKGLDDMLALAEQESKNIHCRIDEINDSRALLLRICGEVEEGLHDAPTEGENGGE